MTDREKAIVMAYTGYTMLTGDKLGLYYRYVEEKLGRPVMTHELCEKPMQEIIRTLSKPDFIELCAASNGSGVMTGWVSVKDRLPEEEDLYAVYCKDGSMALAWFNDNWFIDGCECGAGYVTHWMPLPEPPEDGDGDER